MPERCASPASTPRTPTFETRRRIGYLPENNPLYGDLLVSEYLAFVADLRSLSAEDRRRNIEVTVDEVGLKEVYYLPVSFLSKGYRQRTRACRGHPPPSRRS